MDAKSAKSKELETCIYNFGWGHSNGCIDGIDGPNDPSNADSN